MSEKKYEIVKITTEYITLGQLLKLVNVIGNGSEAKKYVFSHEIKVNNEISTQRGRKLYPSFLIEIDNSLFFEIK